jgi:hypothetical protein
MCTQYLVFELKISIALVLVVDKTRWKQEEMEVPQLPSSEANALLLEITFASQYTLPAIATTSFDLESAQKRLMKSFKNGATGLTHHRLR